MELANTNTIIGVNDAPSISSSANQSETQQITAPTSPQAAFERKTIHPPEAVDGYCGMPTNDTRTQVVVEWKDSRLIQGSQVANGNDPNNDVPPGNVAGFAFLQTSGPNFPLMVFVKYDRGGGDIIWRQDVSNTKRNTVYNMNRFWEDAALYRQSSKSYTYYLNTTAFNDVGIVASYQFNPAIEFTGTIPAFFDKTRTKARKFIEKLLDEGAYFSSEHDWNVDIKASYADYFDNDNDFTHIEDLKVRLNKLKSRRHAELTKKLLAKGLKAPPFQSIDKPYAVTPDVEFQIINFGSTGNTLSGNTDGAIVPDIEQIMNASARSFQCPAKEGQFVVNRLNNLSPKWWATSHNKQAFSPYGLYECWYSFNDLLGNDNYARFVTHAAAGTGHETCLDAFWGDDFTWSWTVFDGLVPNTNISVGSASSQLIQIKGYNGYEIQPSPRSPWAGLQKIAPMPDMAAMQNYERASFLLKDATIAKNNFLAAAAKVLGQVASTVVPGIITKVLHKDNKGQPVKTKSLSDRFAKMEMKTPATTPRSRNNWQSRPNRNRQRSSSRGRSNSRPRSTSRPRSSSRPRNNNRRYRRPRNFNPTAHRKVDREINQIENNLQSLKSKVD